MNLRNFRLALALPAAALFAVAVLPRARSAEVPPFAGHVAAVTSSGELSAVKPGERTATKTDGLNAAEQGEQTAVFAGGCFWGVDAVFKHVKGVAKVVSGYSGGSGSTAEYETVSTGTTGHAESVQVTYDPSRISYPRLLQIFFAVAHDPTQLNRQGPDAGSQYRSVIFYSGDYQKEVAQDYIAQLNRAAVFRSPIVTQVVPLEKFYAAESYHQNYLALNPGNPYIMVNDLPKLDRLRSQFPQLYR